MDINERLCDSHKLKLFLTKNDKDIVSGIVISKIGDTALGLLSASSRVDHDEKYNSSYLLDWEIIKYLKAINCRYYDLRGYSPETYPGPSYYKAGLGGDDVRFIGVYEGFKSSTISIICDVGKWIDKLFTNWRSFRLVFRRKIVFLTQGISSIFRIVKIG